MEFVFSALLLVLNLVDYEINIHPILFLLAGIIILVVLFYVSYLKTNDFATTCMVLMCYTWPVSWINIFGDPTEKLQLSWLYLLGAMLVINAFFNAERISYKRVNSVILGLFVTFLIIFIYPLLLSESISEGLNEFIMIGFFVAMCFYAFFNSQTLDEDKRRLIINAYIFTIVLSSVFIIFQFVYYLTFNEAIFKFSIGNYHGKPMITSKLLMEDLSSATIMLGSGVFFMLERVNNKDRRLQNLAFILITVIAMALTTRRTSIVSLIICFVLYSMLHYRKIFSKIVMFLLFAFIVVLMLQYLMYTRPADSYSDYLEDNGRFAIYLNSLMIFFKNPLGIGYDNVHLAAVCGGTIPHNTILRWLNMGGIVFTVLLLNIIVYIIKSAWKKGFSDEGWVLIYCFVAMNFIPDILNARFFVIPCMLALMCKSRKSDRVKNKLIGVR